MGLFGKKNVFLGIDFGTSTVKIVEIAFKNHRPELTNYASAVVAPGITQGDALQAALKKMKPTARLAYVALPGSSGLVTLISFPQMSHAELAKAVSFEARKHIPIPLEEVNVSWDIVAHDNHDGTVVQAKNSNSADVSRQQSADHGKIYVLLVAAPRKSVAEYESFLAQTRLTLNALELETFSLTRALVGDDMGRFLIADIGYHATNIILVEKGIIRANRNIGTGGANITHSIAESMGLDEQRANVYKHEREDLLTQNGVARQSIDVIVEEMRRVGTSSGTMAENIIITGGTSNLVGIEQYMAKALNAKVTRGNPWARVTIPERVMPFAQDMQGAFSVAIGLALRGVEEYRRS